MYSSTRAHADATLLCFGLCTEKVFFYYYYCHYINAPSLSIQAAVIREKWREKGKTSKQNSSRTKIHVHWIDIALNSQSGYGTQMRKAFSKVGAFSGREEIKKRKRNKERNNNTRRTVYFHLRGWRARARFASFRFAHSLRGACTSTVWVRVVNVPKACAYKSNKRNTFYASSTSVHLCKCSYMQDSQLANIQRREKPEKERRKTESWIEKNNITISIMCVAIYDLRMHWIRFITHIYWYIHRPIHQCSFSGYVNGEVDCVCATIRNEHIRHTDERMSCALQSSMKK